MTVTSAISSTSFGSAKVNDPTPSKKERSIPSPKRDVRSKSASSEKESEVRSGKPRRSRRFRSRSTPFKSKTSPKPILKSLAASPFSVKPIPRSARDTEISIFAASNADWIAAISASRSGKPPPISGEEIVARMLPVSKSIRSKEPTPLKSERSISPLSSVPPPLLKSSMTLPKPRPPRSIEKLSMMPSTTTPTAPKASANSRLVKGSSKSKRSEASNSSSRSAKALNAAATSSAPRPTRLETTFSSAASSSGARPRAERSTSKPTSMLSTKALTGVGEAVETRAASDRSTIKSRSVWFASSRSSASIGSSPEASDRAPATCARARS